jgi:hypothetical protein
MKPNVSEWFDSVEWAYFPVLLSIVGVRFLDIPNQVVSQSNHGGCIDAV